MSRENIRETAIIVFLIVIAIALMILVDPGLKESPYNSF